MTANDFEKGMAFQVLSDAIAAGYSIDVETDEGLKLEGSVDANQCLAFMFQGDEDNVYLCRHGRRVGHVKFGSSVSSVIANDKVDRILENALEVMVEIYDARQERENNPAAGL